MQRSLALLAAVAVWAGVVWTPPARAFHELDCGPFRATFTDDETGETRCGVISPEAQEQFLRARQLQQEQERRTRDLLLKQKRRTKEQELITKLEAARQRQYTLRQSVRQQQPPIDLEQALKLQEVLNRQAAEQKRRGDDALLSGLERERILLEQQIELLKTDLLAEQKLKTKLLRKEQDDR